jgi:hypothetical protein
MSSFFHLCGVAATHLAGTTCMCTVTLHGVHCHQSPGSSVVRTPFAWWRAMGARRYTADGAVLPTTNLDFIGMTGLTDPPKDGVPEAIVKCREAGIRVFMVTGDHPFTAEAIARQV